MAAVNEARLERARLAAIDDIHNSWFRVETEIANARAAQAQVQAAKHAAEVARDRYQSGAATQLEVVQAERDEFSADISRISAQANLTYARAELRLFAGQSLIEGAK
jgi:outer membrane protein TolC